MVAVIGSVDAAKFETRKCSRMIGFFHAQSPIVRLLVLTGLVRLAGLVDVLLLVNIEIYSRRLILNQVHDQLNQTPNSSDMSRSLP